MCRSKKSNLCSKVRKYTGSGVMASDEKSRFTCNGKTIWHFVSSPHALPNISLLDSCSLLLLLKESASLKHPCGLQHWLCDMWSLGERNGECVSFSLWLVGMTMPVSNLHSTACSTKDVANISMVMPVSMRDGKLNMPCCARPAGPAALQCRCSAKCT